MSFDNTNSGAAFKNIEKRSSRSPDFKGSLNVEGEEYWLSIWVKVAGPSAKNPGQKFLSVSVTKKEKQPSTTPVSVSATDADDFIDDVFKEAPKFDEVPDDEELPF